jgi:hypothetical protein
MIYTDCRNERPLVRGINSEEVCSGKKRESIGKTARRPFSRLWCSIYIFTVRGSDSLKLRVDSAGSTISLLPV